MKKYFLVIIFLAVIAGVLPAQSGTLQAWSFSDFFSQMINDYYKPRIPMFNVNITYIPSEQFPEKLDAAFAANSGAPDVFTLEPSFIRKYVESGNLLDLTDIYNFNRAKLMTYPVEIGTHNGRVYALALNAAPGAMFYRRSLAREYLGTDDPYEVQKYFSDFNKLLETARLIGNRSNGACVLTASRFDLLNTFLAGRNQPWVVDGRLHIDPVMEMYMDICKVLYDENLEGRVDMWSEGWFAGIMGENYDQHQKVFAYFLPTWGLQYVLKPVSPHTSGDWAMIQGPSAYIWGGDWIAAWKNTRNVNAAKALITYLTTNNDFQERWALDSHELVGNTSAIENIKNNFSEPFLGGQNQYALFAEIAKNVNGKLVQLHDSSINNLFGEAVSAYVEREKTKSQALNDFRAAAASIIEN